MVRRDDDDVWVVFRDDTAQNNILGVFADADAGHAFMVEVENRIPKDCLLMAAFPIGWRFDHGAGGYVTANRGVF